jgi:hypothetical protein
MKIETLEYIHNLVCERMHIIDREYKMYSNAESVYGEEKKILEKVHHEIDYIWDYYQTEFPKRYVLNKDEYSK